MHNRVGTEAPPPYVLQNWFLGAPMTRRQLMTVADEDVGAPIVGASLLAINFQKIEYSKHIAK